MAEDEAGDPIEEESSEPERDEDEPTEEELEAAAVGDDGEEEEPAKEEEPPPEVAQLRGQVDNINRALRAERREKRELRDALRQRDEREALMQERLDVFMERLAKANGVDVSDLLPDDGKRKIPKPEDDTVGHILGRVEEMLEPVRKTLEEQKAEAQEREVVARVERAAETIDTWHDSDVERVVEEHPDYAEAEEYMAARVLEQAYSAIQQRHPHLDSDEAAQAAVQFVTRQTAQMRMMAYERGQSLAEAVYRAAQAAGWKPGANGHARPAQRPKRPSSKASALRDGLRSNGVLAGGGGRPTKGALTPERIMNLSPDELDELTEKDPQAWKRLVEALEE